MIINVKNGKDVITLDFQLNQIRYCVDLKNHGRIEFLDMNGMTMDCYAYLYKESLTLFLESLAEDMEGYLGFAVDPAKLQVITKQEYMS